MILRNSSWLVIPFTVLCHAGAKAEDVWTTVNDDDPAAVYGPGIQGGGFDGYFHKDLHAGNQPGQWIKFSFEGTGVKWIGAKNGDHGDADVFIDGVLASTVSSKDPQWLKQQDLFTKTGLPLGPHVMKIVIKNGTSDFDAFAFLAPKARAAAMPAIGGVTLPPQQPLLNAPSRYVLGNGVAMVICEATGEIDSAFGPGYTTSDLVKHEDLLIDLDNIEAPLRVNMQRAAGTGIYYGVAALSDLDIGVIDYAVQGEPWISRLILLKNRSGSASHTVIVRDSITPYTDHGYKNWLAIDPAGNCSAFSLQADTTQGVPFGGNNSVDKSVVIAFNDPASLVTAAGNYALLQTKPITLAPGAQHEVSLTHYFRATDALPDVKAIAALRAVDPHATLKKSIDEWTNWTNHVPPSYALSKIADDRARVFVEGAEVLLKTNQSQDGGAIANSPHYKEGYVRDAAMSMRGLLATGHADEAKRWLTWIDKEIATHHHLGDAMSCAVSLNDPSYCMGDGTEVEEPGWVLLVARDYLKRTHDLAFLKSIDSTLRFCADSQLKNEAAQDAKMDFNGDETEICDNLNIEATGFHRGQPWWSLSSVAMAAASVNFYIDYVKATGGDPANYHNALTNGTMNLDAEVKKLVAAMDRDFWRTDVKEIPGGFHEFARHKDDNAWPKARIVNFTLMPVFFGTPYSPDERTKDVAAMTQFLDPKTGLLPLVPGSNCGMDGHDLGYLLWDCVETNDPHKDAVYHALLTGPTVDAWGSFYEMYSNDGQPPGPERGLRSLETGANLSAVAKYLRLGESN